MSDVEVAAAPALTGTQKVAVVLMNLEQAHAARVLSQFSDAEAEDIVSEIIRMRRVDPDAAEQALTEFHTATTSGRLGARGGRDFATGLLETTFGSERAAGVMQRVTSSMAGESFEFLNDIEPHQIISLLDGEMVQTTALVVAHLRPAHASSVLAGLPPALRTDVAVHIAGMTSATPESIALIAASLKARSAAVVSPRNTMQVVGGVQPLVDIINRSNAATERAILEGLDARDPRLAEEVRSRLLTFADIVRLAQRDIQLVLRGIDVQVLAVALKGASEPVQERILSNLSERNRTLVREEADLLGAVRASQVEDARAEVVGAIRALEEAGSITVLRGDEEMILG
jgi:flagellar motor switch protein FliG